MLNRYDRSPPMSGEAEVKYLDGDFRVVRPGAFVRCAVTGVPIPLEELKYWSVDRQEAYATPEAVMQRQREAARRLVGPYRQQQQRAKRRRLLDLQASPAAPARARQAPRAPDRRSCARDPSRW